jgi:hypothetical protein
VPVLETIVANPALRFAEQRHDIADLVLVGLLCGEWQELEARVAHGLELQSRSIAPLRPGELEQALVAFRYERRLIAAADLVQWLRERSLTLQDVEDVLRRRLLRERRIGEDRLFGGRARSGAALASALGAEAICDGTLSRCAHELRGWYAGGAVVAEHAPDTHPAPIDSEAAAQLVSAALAATAAGLGSLDAADLRRRADRLIELRSAFERFRELAVSEHAVDERLAERRVDWTVVTGSEMCFAREGAARETRLAVVHDGHALATLADRLGVSSSWRELEVGRAAGGIQADLLAAREGDLVGPWCEDEQWRVFEVAGRFEPDRLAANRARARDELLSELVERSAAGRASVVAAI